MAKDDDRLKKKSSSKKQITQRVKTLEDIFPQKWVEEARSRFERLEQMDIDKPDQTFLKGFKMMFFYRCVTFLTLEYAPQEILSRIFRDTETVCNRAGISLKDIEEVSRCLSARHEECKGSYYNPVADRTITCKCKCHQ